MSPRHQAATIIAAGLLPQKLLRHVAFLPRWPGAMLYAYHHRLLNTAITICCLLLRRPLPCLLHAITLMLR